jgi:hypothetical protein
MNPIVNLSRLAFRACVPVLVFLTCSAPLWAQDTTTESVRHHPPSYETEVRNAKIVYVEGNDLVLRLENGMVEHLVVPDSDRFNIDGKSLTVDELTPGTTLTQTITTVTTPRFVNTVRVLKGKIWHITQPYTVILTLPDGTHHSYIIPKHAKITIDGKPATVFDLKKGHTLQATIVTDEPQTVVARSKTVVGQAPPATPPMLGVLLFEAPATSVAPTLGAEASPAPLAVASTESVAQELPKTASALPLLALLGLASVGLSLGAGVIRRTLLA